MARPVAKKYPELYPGWPELNPNEIDDEADRRLLLFVHRVRYVIAEYRARGWVKNLRHLAKAAGTSHSQLINITGGKSTVTAETIMKLERALQVALWPDFKDTDLPEICPETLAVTPPKVGDRKKGA